METTELSALVRAEAANQRVRRRTPADRGLQELVTVLLSLETELRAVAHDGSGIDHVLPRFARPGGVELQRLVIDTTVIVRSRAERGVRPHPMTSAEELILLLVQQRDDPDTHPELRELLTQLLEDEELSVFFEYDRLPEGLAPDRQARLEPGNWGVSFAELRDANPVEHVECR